MPYDITLKFEDAEQRDSFRKGLNLQDTEAGIYRFFGCDFRCVSHQGWQGEMLTMRFHDATPPEGALAQLIAIASDFAAERIDTPNDIDEIALENEPTPNRLAGFKKGKPQPKAGEAPKALIYKFELFQTHPIAALVEDYRETTGISYLVDFEKSQEVTVTLPYPSALTVRQDFFDVQQQLNEMDGLKEGPNQGQWPDK